MNVYDKYPEDVIDSIFAVVNKNTVNKVVNKMRKSHFNFTGITTKNGLHIAIKGRKGAMNSFITWYLVSLDIPITENTYRNIERNIQQTHYGVKFENINYTPMNI